MRMNGIKFRPQCNPRRKLDLCRGGRLRPPRDAERSEGERATATGAEGEKLTSTSKA
jgi:hypothetical protein